jgi:predicted enzyme related to lactoylglutathione lyase
MPFQSRAGIEARFAERTAVTDMVNSQGRFVWYELITTDMEAAGAFYANVVGWEMRDASMPGMAYTLCSTAGGTVCGLVNLTAEAGRLGAKPCWIGYVGVDNVDMAATRAIELGGVVEVAPLTIPGVSRFAIITDPQMVALGVFKWLMQRPQVPAPDTAGEVGWHDLMASDEAGAFTFYHALFGWEKAGTETGPLGTYQLFSVASETIGGILHKPPGAPSPLWLHYFNVDDIDAAVKRATATGGQVLYGPTAAPGDKWVVQCMDPQGALFALTGKRKPGPVGYFKRAEGGEASSTRFGG